MTRVTAPMSKLARGLASNPSVARPNYISGAAKAGAAIARTELSGDGRSSEHDSARRGITTAHRPVTVQPNPNRVIPLMQTFHSSASHGAHIDTTTNIDFAVLPSLDVGTIMTPESGIRVPLLPDNFHPDRSIFAPEVVDRPLPAAEISVIAAHPDNVFSALTEVEGMGVDGVELKFVHNSLGPTGNGSHQEGGMIKDVWKGLMDDVFGAEGKQAVL